MAESDLKAPSISLIARLAIKDSLIKEVIKNLNILDHCLTLSHKMCFSFSKGQTPAPTFSILHLYSLTGNLHTGCIEISHLVAALKERDAIETLCCLLPTWAQPLKDGVQTLVEGCDWWKGMMRTASSGCQVERKVQRGLSDLISFFFCLNTLFLALTSPGSYSAHGIISSQALCGERHSSLSSSHIALVGPHCPSTPFCPADISFPLRE